MLIRTMNKLLSYHPTIIAYRVTKGVIRSIKLNKQLKDMEKEYFEQTNEEIK